ncbi:MAG: hypothetical protein JWP15_2608, partial [Alphaproteobacteria bacterium]|nr:hypothetical protein [Alphaproteobacteria bacterium]
MAEDADLDPPVVPAGRRRAQTALKWSGIALAGLLLLVAAGFAWINSD